MDNRPSIEEIIEDWGGRHQWKFTRDSRLPALVELLNDFKNFGYLRSDLGNFAKNKIVDNCYNKESPKERRWRIVCEKDYATAFAAVFPLQRDLTAPPQVIAKPAAQSPVPAFVDPENFTAGNLVAEESEKAIVEYDDTMERLLGWKR